MFRKYRTPQGNSGQSTVEYIVLVTAVIATIIFFVAPGKDGKSTFQNKIINVLNETSEGIIDRSAVLANSHDDTVTYTGSGKTYDVMNINSLLNTTSTSGK